MSRIISDSYVKKNKQTFGDDPNHPSNIRVLAINEMYGWLYNEGILKKAAFEFHDCPNAVHFAVDTKELEAYRSEMVKSNVKDADLATMHIFDEEYTPCIYSGAIELCWPMSTYRNVDGCVGRSWECSAIKGLNNTAIFAVADIQREKGVKEAVKAMYSYYTFPEIDSQKKDTPDSAVDLESSEYGVFLYEGEDSTWKSSITAEPALEGAYKVSSEKNYPVDVYYRRTDVNGSVCFECETCKDRAELEELLNWLGSCRFIVTDFWDYDIKKMDNPDLSQMFDKAYIKRMELTARESEEIFSDYEASDLTANNIEKSEGLNTKIEYLYRDACNYKSWNECVVKGSITEEQKKRIIDCLDSGEYFIPNKVGLPEKRFDEWTKDDHIWFELDEYSFSSTDAPATVDINIAQLVKSFENCKDHWEEKPSLISQIKSAKSRSVNEKVSVNKKDGYEL